MGRKKKVLNRYRVWCNVPHFIDVDAEDEFDAREIASETEFKDLKAGWGPKDIMGDDAQDDVQEFEKKEAV